MVRLRQIQLPLKDLFLKRRAEFEIDLIIIKNFFELNKINLNFDY